MIFRFKVKDQGHTVCKPAYFLTVAEHIQNQYLPTLTNEVRRRRFASLQSALSFSIVLFNDHVSLPCTYNSIHMLHLKTFPCNNKETFLAVRKETSGLN